MLKLHPRATLVARARNDIGRRVTEVWEALDLTPLEVLIVLVDLAREYSKFPLRDERHPHEPGKKADEA